MKMVGKMILKLVIAAALVYVSVAVLLYIFQTKMIFHPFRVLVGTPADYKFEYKDLTLKTGDGVDIHAWFIPAPEADAPVILYCHGNAGNISHRLDSIALFRRLGLGVMIFDYRGYGRSGGSVTEAGLYEDAAAAWNHLTETAGIPPGDIIILGRSLGGAVAANLAAKHPCRALILETAFLSIPDMAGELYPFFPARMLSRYRLETKNSLRKVEAPVLITYTLDDEIVPASHGRRLFELAPEPKTRLLIRGDHNNCYFIDAEKYLSGTGDFIRELRSKAR